MKVKAIKTRKFLPPKDDIFSLLRESFSRLRPQEKSVVVVTSKIVSIGEGRCVPVGSVVKDDLIRQEADYYLPRSKYVMLTMKNDVLIPTAGIDESNANGYYVLWPEHPFLSAQKIHDFLRQEYRLAEVGVVISDSHTVPLRAGMTGVAISYWGFDPLRDYRGSKDIFGRELKMTQVNVADALAAAAVLLMGEGAEQLPIAVVEDLESIVFTDADFSKQNPLVMDPIADLYAPLMKGAAWKKGES